MTVVAAMSLGLAVELCWPSGRRLTRWRLQLPFTRPAVPRRAPLAVLLVLAVVVLARLDGPQLLVGVAAALGGATTARIVVGGRRRALAAARRREAVEAVSLLAAEVRAGALAEAALRSAASEFDLLAGPARAAVHGADVVVALHGAGDEPGAEVLHDLAAAWWVADRAGAPLSAVLARLAERSRDDLDLAGEVEAELAPARATARLMAVLPAFGLALGSGLGGDPVDVLLDTVPGSLCLVVGVALACLGVLWIERVATGTGP